MSERPGPGRWLHVLTPKEVFVAVEAYAHRLGVSRAEAARRLICLGLNVPPVAVRKQGRPKAS